MHYLKTYREMISLRGLTDHTIKSYSTYIRSYLNYLQAVLHKQPEDVSWGELRDFIRWLQKERSLSDRTMNACISQLRFFTMYVLHKPWDPTQLPMRKFDSYRLRAGYALDEGQAPVYRYYPHRHRPRS